MSDEQPQSGPEREWGPRPGASDAPGEGSGLPSAPPPDDHPYGSNPYGGSQGAVDPLAGMPPLADLWRRLLARIIDLLIVGIPVSVLLWLAAGDYDVNGMGNAGSGDGGSYLRQAVLLLVYFVYEGAMLSARGQTVGKMLMRIRVAMLDNGAVPAGSPAWLRAGTYSLVQLLPCFGFLFWLVNVLFCTWDRPYRQCLHDKAARTVVVSAA
ncbi:RDD family protein [Streptomyces sp. 7-21]|jgi:uncharacterized RDD family membrane protein YckC|uniref:RDD family protein n=1 Tax=Streptomyces sp. 7-21 TaxID=2802283 RepID=UPI00191FDF56|nr:RDD family protein [Streptomyces sp. 7-21]MBL1068478.1 RDD family protein [Streptomyces sp. 7-21]